jgi:histidinol-phosphate aminotransferase
LIGLDEEAIVKLASNENPFGVPESAVQGRRARQPVAAEAGRDRASGG